MKELHLAGGLLTYFGHTPVVPLRLRKVTYLTAAGNELTGEGLDGVRALKDLKVLNASGNRVRRVPPAVFSQFRQLQALVLNNNEISEVPPTWLKKGLLSLNTLVLSHNKVCALACSSTIRYI